MRDLTLEEIDYLASGKSQKVYKLLKVRGEQLFSAVAGCSMGASSVYYIYPSLEYAEGQVTEAPADSDGLWSYAVVHRAVACAAYNKKFREGLLSVVHEAYTLDEAETSGPDDKLVTNSLAIVLGKRVWAEEAPVEEPALVDAETIAIPIYVAEGSHLPSKRLVVEIYRVKGDVDSLNEKAGSAIYDYLNTQASFPVWKGTRERFKALLSV